MAQKKYTIEVEVVTKGLETIQSAKPIKLNFEANTTSLKQTQKELKELQKQALELEKQKLLNTDIDITNIKMVSEELEHVNQKLKDNGIDMVITDLNSLGQGYDAINTKIRAVTESETVGLQILKELALGYVGAQKEMVQATVDTVGEIDRSQASIVLLREELKKLRDSYSEMNQLERDSKIGKETVDGIEELGRKIRDAEDSIKKFALGISEYQQKARAIRVESRDATALLGELIEKGITLGVEFEKLAKSAASYSASMAYARNTATIYRDGLKQVNDTLNVASTAMLGFQTYQGVLAVMGDGGKEFAQVMEKIAGTMAIVNGLQKVSQSMNQTGTATNRIYTSVLQALGLEKEKVAKITQHDVEENEKEIKSIQKKIDKTNNLIATYENQNDIIERQLELNKLGPFGQTVSEEKPVDLIGDNLKRIADAKETLLDLVKQMDSTTKKGEVLKLGMNGLGKLSLFSAEGFKKLAAALWSFTKSLLPLLVVTAIAAGISKLVGWLQDWIKYNSDVEVSLRSLNKVIREQQNLLSEQSSEKKLYEDRKKLLKHVYDDHIKLAKKHGLDTTELEKKKNDELYKLLLNYAKKITGLTDVTFMQDPNEFRKRVEESIETLKKLELEIDKVNNTINDYEQGVTTTQTKTFTSKSMDGSSHKQEYNVETKVTEDEKKQAEQRKVFLENKLKEEENLQDAYYELHQHEDNEEVKHIRNRRKRLDDLKTVEDDSYKYLVQTRMDIHALQIEDLLKFSGSMDEELDKERVSYKKYINDKEDMYGIEKKEMLSATLEKIRLQQQLLAQNEQDYKDGTKTLLEKLLAEKVYNKNIETITELGANNLKTLEALQNEDRRKEAELHNKRVLDITVKGLELQYDALQQFVDDVKDLQEDYMKEYDYDENKTGLFGLPSVSKVHEYYENMRKLILDGKKKIEGYTEEQIAILEKEELEYLKLGNVELAAAVRKRIEQLEKQLEKYKKDLGIILKDNNKLSKELIQVFFKELSDLAEKIGLMIGGVATQVFAAMNQEIQFEMDLLQAKLNETVEQLSLVEKKGEESKKRLEGYLNDAREAEGGRLAVLEEQANREMAMKESLNIQEEKLRREKEKREKEVAALEKKQKKLQIQQQMFEAVSSVLLGVLKALSAAIPPLNYILLGAVGLAGLIQIATIAKAMLNVNKMADGGLLTGNSHLNGGIPVGNTGIEVEGNEFVINKQSTKRNLPLIEYINDNRRPLSLSDMEKFYSSEKSASGRKNFKRQFEDGGRLVNLGGVGQDRENILELIKSINFNPVVSVVDINNAQGKLTKVMERLGY